MHLELYSQRKFTQPKKLFSCQCTKGTFIFGVCKNLRKEDNENKEDGPISRTEYC